MDYDTKFSALLGRTVIAVDGLEVGGDRITLSCSDGSEWVLYHSQDCCESVAIEDVTGNPQDIIGSPLTMADESSNQDNPPVSADGSLPESHTWTFYKLATVRGYLDIRWLGESNGYYSESVTFAQTKEAA